MTAIIFGAEFLFFGVEVMSYMFFFLHEQN